MTIIRIPAAFITALLMLAASVMPVDGRRNKESKLTIVGTVIAYEVSVTRLAQLTFVPNTEVLIVRLDKLIKGQEYGRYIKVIYRYGTDEPSLPREIFNSKKQWRFTLKRDRSCDGSLQEMIKMKDNKPEVNAEMQIPQLQRTPGAELERISPDSTLPCYVLRPLDFKPSGDIR